MATEEESLRPVLIRSSTPGPGEKVQRFLQGMQYSPPLPPESNNGSEFDKDEYRDFNDWMPERARSILIGHNLRRTPDGDMTRLEGEVFGNGNGSVLSYPDMGPDINHVPAEVEEADSLHQEQSERAASLYRTPHVLYTAPVIAPVPIHPPVHAPIPGPPPPQAQGKGRKNKVIDSMESFGNLGTLQENTFGPIPKVGYGGYSKYTYGNTPTWAAANTLPERDGPTEVEVSYQQQSPPTPQQQQQQQQPSQTPSRQNYESTPAWAAAHVLPSREDSPSLSGPIKSPRNPASPRVGSPLANGSVTPPNMIHIAIQPPTDSQPNSRRGSQHPGDSQQKSLPRTPTQESAQLPPGAKGGKGKARADEGVIPGSPMRSAPAQAPPSPARTPRQTPSAMPQDLPTTPRQRTVAPSASASGVKSPVVNSVHPSGVALPESMAGETYISGTTRTPTQGSVPLDKAESQRSPTIRAASPKPPTRQARSQSQSQGRAPSHAPSQAPSQAPTQAARSKAPSYAPSRVDTATIPSQALPSPRAPSQQMSMAPSKAGTQRTGAGPGQAPSQQPMRASQAAPSASGQTHHTHHTHVQTQNLAQGQGQSRSATPSRVARAPSDEDVRTVRGGTSTPTPGYPGPSPYPQSQQQQPSRGPTPQLQQQQQRQAPSAQHYDDDEDRQFTEAELVEILRTPRTVQTISPSVLAAEVNRSHFHDEDLCILLHAADDEYTHEVVKKAIRKAVKARLKKLGYEHESEFLREINGPGHGNGHGHSHGQIGNGKARPQAAITAGSSRGTGPPPSQDPPEWALGLIEMVNHAHQRLDSLHYKFDHRVPSETDNHDGHEVHDETAASEAIHDYEPDTSQKIVPIETRPVSGHAQEYYNGGHHDDYDEEEEHFHQETPGEDHLQPSEYDEETYRMRVKQPAGSEASHRTWEIEKSGGDPANRTMALDAIPEITGFDENSVYYADDPTHRRDQGRAVASPLAPGLHVDALATGPSHQPHQPAQPWPSTEWQLAQTSPPPWQRVHQKLLGWAMIWPLSEFDNGLASTAPGNQIDEVALSIYLTQVYKRYVRSRHTDNPPARVDRLFVPPNIADAISNAVFNGRHGDACQMLRDMWTPFGLDGMPRLLIVLAKHRRDSNHYVVHRFSLPEGTLTTYDTHPERAAPDGRPLGWWFAIRAAWPHAMYPHPDHLVQKMVRFHRPHQPLSDNSVAAVAIWRNLIMGSRAERSTDLVRLRELINNEVKSLRQRKEMGRLSVTATKSGWEATA